MAYKKEHLASKQRAGYLRWISKPGSKAKRFEYLKKWRRNNRDKYNFYQKMYAIYGKKANWPK